MFKSSLEGKVYVQKPLSQTKFSISSIAEVRVQILTSRADLFAYSLSFSSQMFCNKRVKLTAGTYMEKLEVAHLEVCAEGGRGEEELPTLVHIVHGLLGRRQVRPGLARPGEAIAPGRQAASVSGHV